MIRVAIALALTPGAVVLSAVTSSTAAARGPAARTSCRPAALRVRGVSATAASTHDGFLLRYTNAGPSTCWIRGYARVTVYGPPHPQPATDQPSFYLGGHMTESGRATPLSAQPRATLRPGASAYEWVGDDDASVSPSGACPRSARARVVVDADSAAGATTLDVTLAVPHVPLCWSSPLVTPIVPLVAQTIDDSFVSRTPGSYYLP